MKPLFFDVFGSLKTIVVIAVGLLLGFTAPSSADQMTTEEFEKAALENFNIAFANDEGFPGIAKETFNPNFAFPEVKPNNADLPWMKTDPITEPETYMRQVLDYAMKDCGGEDIDWDGARCGWFHAPWMHPTREPLRGLTPERSSRLGELHPSQTKRGGNFAVSLYNDVGAFGFHKIWKDPARPKTNGFAFDNGTVSIKLLFSNLTVEQVPYLRHAMVWEIFDPRAKSIIKVRLIQFDIAVKDDRLKDSLGSDLTGWVFGSFLFNGSIETEPRCDNTDCEIGRWQQRLVPIGLQWGNDPQIYANPTGITGKPVQGWINPRVGKMFEAIRLASGHPGYLGRDWRLNGPVDNHRSTCMACHGRAIDFGQHEENPLKYIPFNPHDDAANDKLRAYFRNLNSDEPHVEGTQSMDYSLQAALGVRNFREWVSKQSISDALRAETSDFTPGNYEKVKIIRVGDTEDSDPSGPVFTRDR